METLMNKISEKGMTGALLTLLATVALWMTALNVNATCALVAHQPELPKEANSLRKF